MGRISTYDDAKATEICERLANGEPLAVICRDEGMPNPSTVWRWEQDRPELAQAIARARLDGYDRIAADAMSIADEEPPMVVTEGGGVRVDAGHVQWAKNRAEIRLKLLAKWDPRRYGDKTMIGSDPDNPLPAGFAVHFVEAHQHQVEGPPPQITFDDGDDPPQD